MTGIRARERLPSDTGFYQLIRSYKKGGGTFDSPKPELNGPRRLPTEKGAPE